MKKAFFSALVLAAALASCTKEPQDPMKIDESAVKMVPVTFTAGLDTKTHLGTDKTSVIWQSGDEISIFANGNNYEFTLSSGANTSSGVFTGEMSETDAAAAEFYALYPYSSAATISGDVISTAGVSNSINNVTGNFPNKFVQSVAHSTDMTLDFKLVCSLLKVTVPSSMDALLKNVMVSANAGASTEAFIGGSVAITVSDEPTVSVTGGSADVMTTKSAGIAAGDYYLPVYPETLTKGLRVKMEYVDGRTAEYLYNGAQIVLSRAKIVNVGTLRPQPTYMFEDFESCEDGVKPVWVSNEEPSLVTFDGTKCLKREGTNASGYTQISFTGDEAKVRFPYAARDKFKAIRIKVYVPEGQEFYPILQINSAKSAPNIVNGEESASYSTGINAGAWNSLEFHFSSCTAYGISTASSVNYIQVRPFCDKNGEQLNDNVKRTCYIDDIEFLYN